MAFLKSRVATFYDKEILKYPTGLEATKNVVISSGGLAADPVSGRVIVEAGTLLVKATAVTGVNEVQTLTLAAGATSGGYQLQFTDPANQVNEITGVIDNAATGPQVQTALESIVGVGNVTVGARTGAGPWTYAITFGGRLAGRNLPMLVVVNNTTPGAVTVAETTPGVTAVAVSKCVPAADTGVVSANMVGILTHTVEFFYPVEYEVTDEPAAAYFHGCVFDTTKLVHYGDATQQAQVKAAFPTCLFQ